MINSYSRVSLAGILLIALNVCGCINVEYTGQSFPPLPEGTTVTLYSPESPAPVSGYRAIGRATVTAPQGWSMSEVREKLVDLALEHGADAVNVVESKRIQVGLNAPDQNVSPAPNWGRDTRNAGGAFVYSNYFGDTVTAEKADPVYELQVKALLLATDARFKAMEELYKAERRKLEANSAAAEKTAAPAVDTPETAAPAADTPGAAVPAKKSAPAPRRAMPVKLNSDRNAEVIL